jgi:hypothetical protein
MPRTEKVEVVEVEHDKERLEQTRTPMKDEEQRSAKRTTVDGNTISTNSNDAELGGFTITLAAPSLDETVAEQSNRQQSYIQQRHDAQDAENAEEQEEVQRKREEVEETEVQVQAEDDTERQEQELTHTEGEEQRSAERTTADGNTISTNSNDAELGGFTITLAAPSLDETVAEESNRQKQELDQNYVQQRHDDAQDAEDAGEQEELQAAGSEMQSGNAEDAVVNALNVQDNPHEAGSFLVELPPGTRSGNLVRAMLPSLTGELCHIACFDP